MANSHSAGRRMLRVRTGGAAPGGLSVVPSLADRMQASDRRNALLPQVTALHAALLKRLDLEKLRDVPDEDARGMVQDGAQAIIDGGAFPVAAGDRSRVISMVVNEVLGYGPLQELLDDPAISEIMVNGPDHIYVERDGRIAPSGVVFRDDAHIRRVAERILSAIGRRVDESSPLVDARLPDGSRVNITILRPRPHSSTITIRKFRKDRYAMLDLAAAGTLDDRITRFLGICAAEKLNILISGGTGSGKTTMLNAISAYIPATERVVTIEDPIELSLQGEHVISMEARPPDMAGKHAITQRDLLRNALRMRPDRIIVGEIRGAEAFDMLQAMNTGHEGSLSTVHANTPRDALARVENMVLMAGMELPLVAIREQIASAVHSVVQLQRMPDGVRRIIKVTEVAGMEGQHVTLQDLFVFQQQGRTAEGAILGEFHPTGLRPTFAEMLDERGAKLETALFTEAVA